MNETDKQEKAAERKITAVRELVRNYAKSCDTAETNEDDLIQAQARTALMPDPPSAMYYTADDLRIIEEKDGGLSMTNLEELMIDEFEDLGFQDDGTLYGDDDGAEIPVYYHDNNRK